MNWLNRKIISSKRNNTRYVQSMSHFVPPSKNISNALYLNSFLKGWLFYVQASLRSQSRISRQAKGGKKMHMKTDAQSVKSHNLVLLVKQSKTDINRSTWKQRRHFYCTILVVVHTDLRKVKSKSQAYMLYCWSWFLALLFRLSLMWYFPKQILFELSFGRVLSFNLLLCLTIYWGGEGNFLWEYL